MSPGPRTDTRWWGWGDPGVDTVLPDGGIELLRSRGIEVGRPRPVGSIGDIQVTDPAMLPDSVVAAVGSSRVFVDPESRIRHSGGQAIGDLMARRAGSVAPLPDAVLVPADSAEVGSLLEACDSEGVAVVPFGGGTSVVGGVRPDSGGHQAVISLDLCALKEFELDRVSSTARFGAGLRGAEAEALLRAEGLTLGHFPQSFEYATIGGFAATRSSGQASTGYGRFDRLVTSVELLSPTGPLTTLKSPHTSAGPSLRETILGSEGCLGVIPWVEVGVRARPEVQAWEGWVVPDFGTGCELVRKWVQRGTDLSVVRVSDPDETAISLAQAAPAGLVGRAFRKYLDLRGVASGSLMVIGLEGSREEVRLTRNALSRDLKDSGAASLGRRAGESWSEGRFHGPYLREALLDRGLVVETVETAASWSEHPRAYDEIRASIEARLGELGCAAIVMCHLSHAYRDGASLYFTVVASCPGGDPVGSWLEVKARSMEVITGLGLTVSHHHATGRDHAAFLEAEAGPTGLAALRALKRTLDPNGIMNPGCLLVD